jgi:hypothetical protein
MTQTPSSVIRQDVESFEALISICSGAAKSQVQSYPGGLVIKFEGEDGQVIATFVGISSVCYFHELLCDKDNYPYPKASNFVGGLYECLGSSYLERLHQDMFVSGQTFKDDRHFVYWDDHFCWQITCRSVRLEKTDKV